jgi:uncharacterized iron-regulated protein
MAEARDCSSQNVCRDLLCDPRAIYGAYAGDNTRANGAQIA